MKRTLNAIPSNAAPQRGRNVTAERLRVEQVLEVATEAIDSDELARRADVPRRKVNSILQDLRRTRWVVNVGRTNHALWRRRGAVMAAAVHEARICNASIHARYEAHELQPFTGRPGAMDFKRCPSRGIA